MSRLLKSQKSDNQKLLSLTFSKRIIESIKSSSMFYLI